MPRTFVQEPYEHWESSLNLRDYRSMETQASSFTRQILKNSQNLYCSNRVNTGPFRATRAKIAEQKIQIPHNTLKEDLWGWHPWTDPAHRNTVSQSSEFLLEGYSPSPGYSLGDNSCHLLPAQREANQPVIRTFYFSQNTPSPVWVINHNLGFTPSVEIFDCSRSEMEGDVTHPSFNQTVIKFNVPLSGSARLN